MPIRQDIFRDERLQRFSGSQFVQQLKGRLVAANAELPLKRLLRTKVLSRRILAGDGCRGPAIIQEYDTAVVEPPGWSARSTITPTS